jgi:tetratricopeptide (TPR) repeat protein
MKMIFAEALKLFFRLSLFGCLLLLFAHKTMGQQTKIVDSLNAILASTRQDTTKVLALVGLSGEYKNYNLDSAMLYSGEAMRIAREAGFIRGIAASYYAMGDIEVRRDDSDKAKQYFLESTKFYKQCGAENELPAIYLVIGSLHTYQDEWIEALEYFQKALELSEKYKLRKTEGHAYNNLGSIYKNLEKYDKALECFNKALEISTELGLKDVVYYIYGNLGILYATQGDKKLAESYFKKLLQISRDEKDEVVEAFAMVSLGDFNVDIENYQEALSYYHQALEMADAVNANYSGPKSLFFANVYAGIGKAQYFLNNYDTAIDYLTKGFEKANETGQLSIVAESADKLSYAYEFRNQTASALKYSRIYQATRDSLQNMDNVKRVTEIEMQNKFDKLMAEKEFEQALSDARQKRNEAIYLLIIGGSFLGLVIFLLLFLLQKSRHKRVKLESENLQLEKENLYNDLAYKNKELTTNVMYLLKKNELIHSVCDKLKKAKMSFKVENRILVEDVIRDLESASKGDIWKEFELRFQEVHSDFYKKLNELFPNLTPNELKLCAFLRLNMSSKDIAAITFLSVNSINIARHRLRKKLNIEQEENLIIFLSSL